MLYSMSTATVEFVSIFIECYSRPTEDLFSIIAIPILC
jgi:hypothetical protein